MQFVAIPQNGQPVLRDVVLPEVAQEICRATAALYIESGYQPPWLGYLVLDDTAGIVGTCAFKSPPRGGRVEIAYFTFPENEGQGLATSAADHLVALAFEADAKLTVIAQTLPAAGASTRILEKLGFQFAGETHHAEDGLVWEWHLRAGDRARRPDV
jgi:ribosomal-protein-alanine N-acetyltransferase